MTLEDVRDFIAGLGIAGDEHCYMGKLDGKKTESIGSYKLKRSGKPTIPLGGMENASYGTYPVSFLIHWNQSPRDTEEASEKLFRCLMQVRDVKIGEEVIKFCSMLVPEPQDIGTDDNGIYEMVVEAEFIYERKEFNERRSISML